MASFDWKEAGQRLTHVYWVGGASSAGKSTISTLLEQRHGMFRYYGDGHLRGDHRERATMEYTPFWYKFMKRSENEKPFLRTIV